MRCFVCICLLLVSFTSFGQYHLKGVVYDEYGNIIQQAHIDLNKNCSTTDAKGFFELQNISRGNYLLRVQAKGFSVYEESIYISSDDSIEIVLLSDASELLQEIVIHKDHELAYNATQYSNKNIQEHFAGSLAASLANIPGVNAMEIGSGASKPIIRGLGFNRVAVSENGLKQEGQQWGADHGLEIDALQTEEVEVIKGVGTIAYGSDAIGGVIQINNEKVPLEGIHGKIILHGKTVNESIGTSVGVQERKDRYFYKIKLSGVDYADFKVPTNEINYLNTRMPVYNNRMKNTAGNEYSMYLQGGYISEHFQNILSISNVYSKMGFFPGAHGVPNIGAVQHDGSYRNIEYPYQSVNHFKIVNTSKWFNEHSQWKFSLGFQQNHREEYSRFHTHFGNQNPPDVNPDLELQFVLNTLDTQLSYEFETKLQHLTKIGIQHNYQVNSVGGYSFLMPEFNRQGLGLFATHHWDVSDHLQLEAGIRSDFTRIRVHRFFDDILYNYLLGSGREDQVAQQYALRSDDLDNSYWQNNISVGGRYSWASNWVLTFTAGTNFRLPTAMELSANGIHHGAFRHELGNAALDPEKGWSAEVGLQYKTEKTSVQISPYIYHFSNYIFLKPSGQFSILPHGGQVYQYDQSGALITGVEMQINQKWRSWELEANFESVYNRQIAANGANYPLPFTPPMAIYGSVYYHINENHTFQTTKVGIQSRWVATQNRIAQNESKTPSYWLLGLMAQTQLNLGKVQPTIRLQATNLLNKKYYNHASFYRPIEIPELGRNIQLMISIPF